MSRKASSASPRTQEQLSMTLADRSGLDTGREHTVKAAITSSNSSNELSGKHATRMLQIGLPVCFYAMKSMKNLLES